MLKRVGFFDFVHGSGDPFGCLEKALDRTMSRHNKRDLSGSLIALPEAFNIGKPYYPPPGTFNAPGAARVSVEEALAKLRDLAVEHTIVFVAGLLDQQYSSAYWVDPDSQPALMCHKMGGDDSANYIRGDDRDPNNPIQRYGACVGALICIDALDCREQTQAALTRRKKLVTEMKSRDQVHRIMCIPAHMSDHCMPRMDGLWCILASSGPQRSVVKDPLNTEVLKATSQDRGQICLADLPLDRPRS
jgi:predicted amidohydrolase